MKLRYVPSYEFWALRVALIGASTLLCYSLHPFGILGLPAAELGFLVTTDFNLNKVARVQGISILNVNELANAMKPAVLPGEAMRVLILREGREASQGVAYLDDGTMVVVDGARRHINRTIDIVVTSTHQTPAGKMIFARVEDRTDACRIAAGRNRPPAAAASPRFESGVHPPEQ